MGWALSIGWNRRFNTLRIRQLPFKIAAILQAVDDFHGADGHAAWQLTDIVTNVRGKHLLFIRQVASTAASLATQLNDDGFEVVAFGQGYASMNWPTKPSKKKSIERIDGIVALIMALDRASWEYYNA